MIRRTLLALAFVIATVTQPLAWFVGGGQLHGFNVGGETLPPTITFLQCTFGPTGTNPYTFASQNVGTASATRATLVGITAEDNAADFNPTAVTVGGDSATELVDINTPVENTNAGFYILSNPAGTSENVVVTFSEALSSSTQICLWSITDLTSLTAHDTAEGESASAAAITLNMDFQANGVGAAIGIQENGSQTFTWTGMTERHDEQTGSQAFSGADYTATVSETNRSISCDSTGSTSETCVSVSLR